MTVAKAPLSKAARAISVFGDVTLNMRGQRIVPSTIPMYMAVSRRPS